MARIVLVLLVLLLSVPSAQAQKRVALLIGNQAYSSEVGVLRNPHNDIEVMAASLKQVGFEILPLVKDARRSAMLGAVRQLVARLAGAGSGAVGFLYYSGHGAAESATGVNYLIPVDATNPDTAEFWDQSLKLDDVLKLLEGAPHAAHFVVFDACRNELNLQQRSTSKGFIPVAEQAGMFIAFATAPGRPASDRGDRSGPYAAALSAELVKPGQHHLDLFQNVKESVTAASGSRQVPWERNGLGRRIYFSGDAAAPAPAPVPPQAFLGEAERAWGAVRDSSSIAALEAFVSRYRDSFYADLAKTRIDDLKRIAAAAPPPAPPPPPKAAAPAAASPINPALSHRPRPRVSGETCQATGGHTYCVSSVLAPQFGITYPPSNMTDGRLDTAWVEGNSGDGIGEWVVIDFGRERRLSGLEILNGYHKNDRLFKANNRVRELELVFSSGRSQVVTLQDAMTAQRIGVDQASSPATWVQLKIRSVYAGNKYRDTAITELRALMAD